MAAKRRIELTRFGIPLLGQHAACSSCSPSSSAGTTYILSLTHDAYARGNSLSRLVSRPGTADKTIPTLWGHVKDLIKLHPEHVACDDGRDTYVSLHVYASDAPHRMPCAALGRRPALEAPSSPLVRGYLVARVREKVRALALLLHPYLRSRGAAKTQPKCGRSAHARALAAPSPPPIRAAFARTSQSERGPCPSLAPGGGGAARMCVRGAYLAARVREKPRAVRMPALSKRPARSASAARRVRAYLAARVREKPTEPASAAQTRVASARTMSVSVSVSVSVPVLGSGDATPSECTPTLPPTPVRTHL
ncbi:hypothetical protein B0H17DRAFT_1206119 [Mycena rosella]|uniref:Uncharacterized protein n=1 Tax=Mycena rosella TaxID=1033263 RepID=A0AAD7GE57_MYCRO|nr:hypothetical protein B0H17DRAFT_1206119 [Mycena rosella]